MDVDIELRKEGEESELLTARKLAYKINRTTRRGGPVVEVHVRRGAAVVFLDESRCIEHHQRMVCKRDFVVERPEVVYVASARGGREGAVFA